MANTQQFLVLACLALIAGTAVAAPCTITNVEQVGVLKSASPKGCLNEDVTQGLVDIICFDGVILSVANATGPGCTAPSKFNVSFTNTTCLEGMQIGEGEMTPVKAGGSTIKGTFATGQDFKGSSDPAGNFIVTVDGVKCDLTYGVKAAATTKALNATAANMTAMGNAMSTSRDAAPSTAAPPATIAAPAKSGAAAAAVPTVMLVLGAALAFAL